MSNAPAHHTDHLISNTVVSNDGITADVSRRDFSLWLPREGADCYWTVDGEVQGLETDPNLVEAMRRARNWARFEAGKVRTRARREALAAK